LAVRPTEGLGAIEGKDIQHSSLEAISVNTQLRALGGADWLQCKNALLKQELELNCEVPYVRFEHMRYELLQLTEG
jgi:hypothetical protein